MADDSLQLSANDLVLIFREIGIELPESFVDDYIANSDAITSVNIDVPEIEEQIAELQISVAQNAAAISVNSNNISQNETDIAQNTTDISTNTGNISANTAAIAVNSGDIAQNTSDISDNSTDIATNTGNIATNTSNIATNTSDISDLNTNIFEWFPVKACAFSIDGDGANDPTINHSYNVTSIVRTGTGVYDVTLTQSTVNGTDIADRATYAIAWKIADSGNTELFRVEVDSFAGSTLTINVYEVTANVADLEYTAYDFIAGDNITLTVLMNAGTGALPPP